MANPRLLRTPSFLLSLGLCLVIATLWLRSYLPETLLWESDSGRVLIIGLPQSPVVAHESRDKSPLEWYLHQLLDPQFFVDGPPPEHRFVGFYYAHGNGGVAGGNFSIVGVPYWFLFTAVAVPTVVLFRRHRLATRRRATGCCPACGYDCRATPERCPECGTIPNGIKLIASPRQQ